VNREILSLINVRFIRRRGGRGTENCRRVLKNASRRMARGDHRIARELIKRRVGKDKDEANRGENWFAKSLSLRTKRSNENV